MRQAVLDGAPGGRSTIPCPGGDAGGPQRLPAGKTVISGGWGGSGAPADCGSAACVSGRAGRRCLSPPPARRPVAARPRCLLRVPARSAPRAAGWVTHAEPCVAAAASQAKPSQAHRRGAARRGPGRSKGRAEGEGEPRAAATPRGARWRAPHCRPEARGGGRGVGLRASRGHTCPTLAEAAPAPFPGVTEAVG